MVGGGYFRVFRVSGAGSAQSVDWASPGRWCLRRWALARALAGVGGAATRVSTRTRSSFGCSPLYFRLQALRICDASQASPRVSERSLSGPTGLEIHVSASVALQKKPACYSTTRTKRTAAITTTPAARPGERCAASLAPSLSGDTDFAPWRAALHLCALGCLAMARIARAARLDPFRRHCRSSP